MRVLNDLRDLTWEAVVEAVEHPEAEATWEVVATEAQAPARKRAVYQRLIERLMRSGRYTEANQVWLAIGRLPWDDADQAASDSLACDDIARGNLPAAFNAQLDADARSSSSFEIPQTLQDPKAEDSGFPEWVRRAYFIDPKRADEQDKPWKDQGNIRRMPLDTLDVLKDMPQDDRFSSEVPLSTTLQFPAHVDGVAGYRAAASAYIARSIRASDAAVAEGALRRGLTLNEGPAAEERAEVEVPRLVRQVWVVHPTPDTERGTASDVIAHIDTVWARDGAAMVRKTYRSRRLDEFAPRDEATGHGRPSDVLAYVAAASDPDAVCPAPLVARALLDHQGHKARWEVDGTGLAPRDEIAAHNHYAGPATDPRVAAMRSRSDHRRVTRRAWMVFWWTLTGHQFARTWQAPEIRAF